MRTVAQKKPSEDHKRQRNITYRHSVKLPAFSSSFLSNDNIIIQRKPICPCDGGCPRCAPVIQPKLIIGQPNDKYEQEADRVADEVMRMPEPSLQRQVGPEEEAEETLQAKLLANQITPLVQVQRQEEPEEEEETLQAKPLAGQITPLVQRQLEPVEEEEEEEELLQAKFADSAPLQRQQEEPEEEEKEAIQTKQVSTHTPTTTPNLASRIQSLKGGGQPLPESKRAFFERCFGYHFSQVRIHNNSEAAKMAHMVNAKAFTTRQDIVFGTGQYAPETAAGEKLLAHELTHVVQQEKQMLRRQTSHFPTVRSQSSVRVQRKLALYSKKDAKAFKWFFTSNDAKRFGYRRATKPHLVVIKASRTVPDDPFRFNIIKTIIKHVTETLLIRELKPDEKIPPHHYYKNGKKKREMINVTLRSLGQTILGAAGITIPSKQLALAVDPNFTGPITGVSNQSWILYSAPTSLAHEFGHAFLLFSGAPWRHRRKIPKSAGIKGPQGKPFVGSVDVFIKQFVEEKFAEIPLLDPGALHFSPTAVRKWPEPPNFKLTFIGTWLKFKKKYPKAEIGQKVVGKGKKKKRQLTVCIPAPGKFCPPW